MRKSAIQWLGEYLPASHAKGTLPRILPVILSWKLDGERRAAVLQAV